MPGLPLQNMRWEKFCQAYVSGPNAGNATAAYVAAGFAGEGTQTARSGAHRLLHNRVVGMRIAELQANLVHVEQQAIRSAAEVLRLRTGLVLDRMAGIAFATVSDYLRRDDFGNVVVDLAAVDRGVAAGIAAVSITEKGERPDRVCTTRIRMCDRHGPLLSLGKHLGLFVDRKGEPHDDLRDMSKEELERELERLRREPEETSAAPANAGQPSAPDRVDDAKSGSPAFAATIIKNHPNVA